MSEAPRKGWCPGALRPMMARDGLLVRLRLTGGRLSAETARAIAALGEFYGNGLFDLSARANLQIRGVGESGIAQLRDALADLGVLDVDPAGEAVRNVIASPLAGFGGGIDLAPIVDALEARLANDTALHALPTKFGFLVDDGGAPTLAGVAADVRFDVVAHGTASRVWIGLGGTRDRAVSFGFCAPGEIVEAAVWIARRFIALSTDHDPPSRRMVALVDRLGSLQAARAFGGDGLAKRPDYSGAFLNPPPVGLRDHGPIRALGLAAPFGRLDHVMLRAAADLADARGRGALRLTPWRCLLVPGVIDGSPLDVPGFITDPSDGRLRVAACVGMAGCERGTTPTHVDAEALADVAARVGGSAIALHVSGCVKGCAKPSRTAITLVGRDGRYDVVQTGMASDTPTRRGVDRGSLRDVFAAKVST